MIITSFYNGFILFMLLSLHRCPLCPPPFLQVPLWKKMNHRPSSWAGYGSHKLQSADSRLIGTSLFLSVTDQSQPLSPQQAASLNVTPSYTDLGYNAAAAAAALTSPLWAKLRHTSLRLPVFESKMVCLVLHRTPWCDTACCPQTPRSVLERSHRHRG